MALDSTLLMGSLCYICVAIIATIGNIYGIIQIYRMSQVIKGKDRTALRRTNLYLLLHMSISDVICGALSTPFSGITLMLQAVGDETEYFGLYSIFCNISGFIQCTTCRMSLFITMLLVIIRVLAIYYPATLSKSNSYKITVHIVYILWTICIFMSSIPYCKGITYKYNIHLEMGWWELTDVFGTGKSRTIGYLLVDVIPFLVPGFVVIVCTVLVLIGLRNISNSRENNRSNSFNKRSIKRIHSHYQATLTTLMVAGVFLLCYGMWWISSLVTLFLYAGWVETIPKAFRFYKDKKNLIFMLSHGFLVYLNCAINPILYHFRLFNNVKKREGGRMSLSSIDKITSQVKNGAVTLSFKSPTYQYSSRKQDSTTPILLTGLVGQEDQDAEVSV